MPPRSDSATTAPEPQAPGAKVVKALGNEVAAEFTAVSIEMARDAFKRELEARTFPDGGAMGLTPVEKKMLQVLESHPEQLVLATTVPTVEGGDK